MHGSVAHLAWHPLHAALISICALPPDLQRPEELGQGWLEGRLVLQVGVAAACLLTAGWCIPSTCTVSRYTGIHVARN